MVWRSWVAMVAAGVSTLRCSTALAILSILAAGSGEVDADCAGSPEGLADADADADAGWSSDDGDADVDRGAPTGWLDEVSCNRVCCVGCVSAGWF